MGVNELVVLVCGSRDWTDERVIFSDLDDIHAVTPIGCIVEGRAPGADKIGGWWAESRGVAHAQFPANWGFYNKGAGPKRNGWMIRFGHPDLVLAYPLPSSRGTYNMIEQAESAGVEVRNYGNPAL